MAGGFLLLAMLAIYSGEIPLLLTDVKMPGMSGPELGEKVLALSPHTKLLFMSGYTDDLIDVHDVDELLRKPFSRRGHC